MNDHSNDANGERTADLFDRISDQLSRRGFLGTTAKIGAGGALLSASAGTAAADGMDDADDQGEEDDGGEDGDAEEGTDEEVSDLDVLNFALTLEHLEAAYYDEFLSEYDEWDVEGSAAARIFVDDGLRFSTYQKIKQVRDHEEAHVEALTETIEALGGDPVEPAEYDFPYESVAEFVDLSATIEAVGVSAYAGAAPLIEDEPVLEAALSIHSVEARHTAYFRLLDTTTPFPSVFDEPRTIEEVLEIASQFIVGMDGEGDGENDEAGEGELSIAGLRAATGPASNPNEEYVEYVNTGDGPLDLTGWTVSNDAGTTYEFPDGFTLAPGETVRLYTGRGTDSSGELYWGNPEEVWDDQIDTMIVRDASDEVVLRRSYS
jgi:rubrerythrin